MYPAHGSQCRQPAGEVPAEDVHSALGAPQLRSSCKAPINTPFPPLTPKPTSKGLRVSPRLRGSLLSLVQEALPPFLLSNVVPRKMRGSPSTETDSGPGTHVHRLLCPQPPGLTHSLSQTRCGRFPSPFLEHLSRLFARFTLPCDPQVRKTSSS